MPIDDINYLYEHSSEAAYMFFVDSGVRNREFYPDPNEYVISFSDPLKLVFGLEVLDAAIPNTMFNIDHHNNKLALMLMQTHDDPAASTSTSTSTSYTSITSRMSSWDLMGHLIAEQQSNETFGLFFNFHSHWADWRVFFIDHEDWVAKPTLRERVDEVLTSFYGNRNGGRPFGGADAAMAAGMELMVISSRFSDAAPTVRKLSDIPASSQASYLTRPDLYRVVIGAMGDLYVMDRAHPASAFIDTLLLSGEAGVAEKDISTHVRYDDGGGRWEVTVSYSVLIPPPDAFDTWHPLDDVSYACLRGVALTLEVGQYDIDSLQFELNTLLLPLGFAVVGTDRLESQDLKKQGRAQFIHTQWPFAFNMEASSIYENLGYESYARPDQSALYRSLVYRDNRRLFASAPDVISGRHTLSSPGIVNLMGARYVRLRCKEIEDHLSSSEKYNPCTVGIGVFKLADLNDISNLRFDFSTFIRKPFHPIGKLSRLTFSFETPRGYRYDFKGFNHTMLISIKYLAPSMPRRFTGSSLNPNYEPDFLRYILNQERFDQRDDDDMLLDDCAEASEADSDDADSDDADSDDADSDDADSKGMSRRNRRW